MAEKRTGLAPLPTGLLLRPSTQPKVEPEKVEPVRVEPAKVEKAQSEAASKSARSEASAFAVAVDRRQEDEGYDSLDHDDRRGMNDRGAPGDRASVDDVNERGGGYRSERADAVGGESKVEDAARSSAASTSSASSASSAQSSSSSSSTQAVRTRRKKTVYTETKGRKLYLPDEIHDRLRLLAFSRREKVSTIAAEILDRNLPRLRIEREA